MIEGARNYEEIGRFAVDIDPEYHIHSDLRDCIRYGEFGEKLYNRNEGRMLVKNDMYIEKNDNQAKNRLTVYKQ